TGGNRPIPTRRLGSSDSLLTKTSSVNELLPSYVFLSAGISPPCMKSIECRATAMAIEIAEADRMEDRRRMRGARQAELIKLSENLRGPRANMCGQTQALRSALNPDQANNPIQMLRQNTHSPVYECLEYGFCLRSRPQDGRHDIKPNQISRRCDMQLRKPRSTDSLCLSFIDNGDRLPFNCISNSGRLAIVERVGII